MYFAIAIKEGIKFVLNIMYSLSYINAIIFLLENMSYFIIVIMCQWQLVKGVLTRHVVQGVVLT